MTDISKEAVEGPERIWPDNSVLSIPRFADGHNRPRGAEYVRTDPYEALQARVADMKEDGQFLVERIEALEGLLGDGDLSREFYGHVEPALARFKSSLAKAEGKS